MVKKEKKIKATENVRGESGGITEDKPQIGVLSKRTRRGRITKANQERPLTPGERKVLAVIANVELVDLPTMEKIRRSGITSGRWYQIMNDPWFQEQARKAGLSWVGAQLGPILRASVEMASKPVRDGFNDRRLMLEMGKLYVPKQEHSHDHDHTHTLAVVAAGALDLENLRGDMQAHAVKHVRSTVIDRPQLDQDADPGAGGDKSNAD